jgi:VIT1/CCC1 family predicted Fe2+/Mn2+ transporter
LTHLLRILGVTLVLGGLGHTAGVLQLYATQGIPDGNRIMLDLWIAEAQILGGALYLAAWRGRRAQTTWRALAAFGAVTMIGFAVPALPLLVARAPLILAVPAMAYLAASLVILAAVAAGSTPCSPHPPLPSCTSSSA